MVKKILVFTTVLIIGIGLGASGHWFIADKLPEMKAMREAQKEQEQLVAMVRPGKVVTVGKKEYPCPAASSICVCLHTKKCYPSFQG